MPFFKEPNILFIHIPKTGGTSIEDYFYSKYQIKRTIDTLFSSPIIKFNSHTLQHCTYQELFAQKEYLSINFDTVKIISVVRNPYYRIFSDLFFFGLVDRETDKSIIFEKIKEFIENPSKYDYHSRPQYEYLVDSNDKLVEKIVLLKYENLKKEFESIGYDNFDLWVNGSYRNQFDYTTLLNPESIKLINEYYKKDFELFGYKVIDI